VISEEKKRVLELFASGRKLYKLMRFKDAGNAFREALVIDPKDGPSREYLKRCDDYLENPPEDDWDGVYVMKHK